jgi:hypothetical protein
LFKDGSFAKQVGSGDGPRVRSNARMRERATIQANVKFGEDLKQTKRQLQKAEKLKKQIAKEGEDKLKRQEVHARQAEKAMTNEHKRRLEKMEQGRTVDRQTMTEEQADEVRDTRQLIRLLRQELTKVEEEPGVLLRQEVEGLPKRQTNEKTKQDKVVKTLFLSYLVLS